MNKYFSDIPGAPRAIGPYSQAVVTGDLVFLSGQIPLDPATGELVSGGIEVQTKQVLKNLEVVLQGLGLTFKHVVKTGIFLIDLKHFATVNEIYGMCMGDAKPARATVQVAGLPRGSLVEIEMIASTK